MELRYAGHIWEFMAPFNWPFLDVARGLIALSIGYMGMLSCNISYHVIDDSGYGTQTYMNFGPPSSL